MRSRARKGGARTARKPPRERGSRAAAAHRARSAPVALRTARAASTPRRARSTLVGLASTPSGPRQSGPHQAPSAKSVTATVVLELVKDLISRG
jgi:hypothetical protein